MTHASTDDRTLREERIVRRMVGRGEAGLAEALCALKGVTFGRRYVFRSLYAIGGEGAVFDVDDLHDPQAPPLVGKVALHPVHQPFELTADGIRRRRLSLRRESVLLATCGGDSMPRDVGHFQFENPALDPGRGDAFAEAEPVLLMEKLPGLDLDRWLARVHRQGVPRDVLIATLDRFAIGVLRGVEDLASRGFLFADLRPGNVRVLPRPFRHVRLLDAGSIVRDSEVDERFPHVPAYLPPRLYRATETGQPIRMSTEVLAEMAGRSLFEIATGEPPYPGEAVNTVLLEDARVSPRVAEVLAALCSGELQAIGPALEHVDGVVDQVAPAPPPRDAYVPEDTATATTEADGGDDWRPADFLFGGDVDMSGSGDRGATTATQAPARPAAKPQRRAAKAKQASRKPARARQTSHPPAPRRSWWRRLLGRLFGS